jgi:hypothetical protein
LIGRDIELLPLERCFAIESMTEQYRDLGLIDLRGLCGEVVESDTGFVGF